MIEVAACHATGVHCERLQQHFPNALHQQINTLFATWKGSCAPGGQYGFINNFKKLFQLLRIMCLVRKQCNGARYYKCKLLTINVLISCIQRRLHLTFDSHYCILTPFILQWATAKVTEGDHLLPHAIG